MFWRGLPTSASFGEQDTWTDTKHNVWCVPFTEHTPRTRLPRARSGVVCPLLRLSASRTCIHIGMFNPASTSDAEVFEWATTVDGIRKIKQVNHEGDVIEFLVLHGARKKVFAGTHDPSGSYYETYFNGEEGDGERWIRIKMFTGDGKTGNEMWNLSQKERESNAE